MLVLTAVIVLRGIAIAGYSISQSVVGTGGGGGSGHSYTVLGTVGQAAFGVADAGSFINEVGFWYQPGWILTGVEDGPPLTFEFGQNHPNPFNPVTTMSFSVPQPADVEIVLYNVTGREVRMLVDERLEPGRHEFVLDASGMPSGIYFARMVAGRFVETRKLVLLK